MNIFHYAVFPSIISEIQCDNFSAIQSDLIKWIEEYKKITDGVIVSNRGGWQSDSNIHFLETFKSFTDYILKYANLASEIYNLEYRLKSMWININKNGDYNVSHSHPGSIISGVLWVKCPKNCGGIVFDSPNDWNEDLILRNIDHHLKKKFNYFHSFGFQQPVDGTMILFPSHMRHHVEPNESNEDRISIAFNLSPM